MLSLHLALRNETANLTGMDQDNRTAFIFGLGFSGMVLARHLRDHGWQVHGTRRQAGEIDGITIHAFSADAPLTDTAVLDGVSHVISTIPVINGEDPVLTAHGADLKRLGCWAGYVSATSVCRSRRRLGDRGQPLPSRQSGGANGGGTPEMAWQDSLDAEVFRAAGIYGPGRSPFRSLIEGKARIILKPGHQFNRIHVDDIARVIAAAMQKPVPRRILNLADGAPL